MLSSLTLFRGPGLKVFAEVVAQCFLAVSVSVMHDQCRKYSVTCNMHVWRAGGMIVLLYRHALPLVPMPSSKYHATLPLNELTIVI